MFDFHRRLLADEARVHAFRDALRLRLRPGDVVLDLGSGTGILSLLACDLGARRVYAVERGAIADAAAFLVRHLGYDDRIAILHAPSRTVELPARADLLVTETLGVLGLDEGIAGSVIDARARLLRDGAAIIPQHVVVSVAPVELPADAYERHVAWWSEPRFGFDVSLIRTFASNTVVFERIDTSALLAGFCDVIAVDLETAGGTFFSGSAELTTARPGTIHGFAGCFRATLAPGVVLSNSDAHTTHWPHGFFPLERPVDVAAGVAVRMSLETNDGRDWRWRGSIGAVAFDQATAFSIPPCGHDDPAMDDRNDSRGRMKE